MAVICMARQVAALGDEISAEVAKLLIINSAQEKTSSPKSWSLAFPKKSFISTTR